MWQLARDQPVVMQRSRTSSKVAVGLSQRLALAPLQEQWPAIGLLKRVLAMWRPRELGLVKLEPAPKVPARLPEIEPAIVRHASKVEVSIARVSPRAVENAKPNGNSNGVSARTVSVINLAISSTTTICSKTSGVTIQELT